MSTKKVKWSPKINHPDQTDIVQWLENQGHVRHLSGEEKEETPPSNAHSAERSASSMKRGQHA